MNKNYIRDIKDRDPVNSVFLVKDKITAMAKNGKPYLTVRLMDKTGEVDCKVWDNVDEVAAQFERDDFVAVRGKATIYLGKMQLVIADLKRVPDTSVDLADFLPTSDRDIDEMLAELHALLASLSDTHLHRLLTAFFYDAEFMTGFRTAPAAKGMHHVFIGGLLEHSLAVAKLVDAIVPNYAGLNRDLLIAGALLHDAGKVREMAYLRSFDYTDEGKLLGHITIGVEMVHEKISALQDFPPELAMLLKHMILSHHGQYEFGSPKRPKTLEATILNYLDDLDSKINGIRTHIGKEPDSQSNWTSYHRLYDRYFYKESCREEMEQSLEEPAFEEIVSEPQVQISTQQPQTERKSFQNNPFAKLKNENLDLF